MRSQPIAIVFTKFTLLKDIKPSDHSWALLLARETNVLLQKYCYEFGNILIVPNFYVRVMRDLLEEKEENFRARGYKAVFKILHPKLEENELMYLRTQVLVEIKNQISGAIHEIRRCEKTMKLVSRSEKISQNIDKAKELLLLFNLESVFPSEALKISRLIDLIHEKFAEHQLAEDRRSGKGNSLKDRVIPKP